MVSLTRTSTDRQRGASRPIDQPDDLSDHAHRQLIGYIGLSLPIVLVMVAGVRSPEGPDRWKVLDSVSAYYYSGAIAVFVGLLVALSLFLLTYRGYENKYHKFDRAAAVVGGLAALGVAFFPTRAPQDVPKPDFWEPVTGMLHYSSAVTLFTMFAVFSLWLFRLKTPGERATRDKRLRNHLYLMCGVTIVASIVWAVVNGRHKRPIFVPESIAVMAFAVSWLAKGRALRTIRLVLDRC